MLQNQHEESRRPRHPDFLRAPQTENGTGPGSDGQSGDTQGLSDVAEAGSESVEELVEEGQYDEANLIDSMEKDFDGELHPSETAEIDPAQKKLRHKTTARPD